VPDISVFTLDRLPRDASGEIADLFELAPDWAIEILSPDQSPIRVIKNILHCLEYGAEMGWLIDPKEKTVLVYLPNQQVKILDNPESIIPVPPWASHFSISIDELFGWLML
jgi:Uma2 family endonuclease